MNKKESFKSKPSVQRKRHIAKTITWRIIGTLDTFIIGKILLHFFGYEEHSTEAAGFIAVLELITKTILYYFHERIWFKLWIATKQKVRHIIKTVSWRLVGAIDTVLLVFIVFYLWFPLEDGGFNYAEASKMAMGMFSIEVITKMILYYFHERIWVRSNFGVVKQKIKD